MDRLDVELYAERLARHVEWAADELADARLRAAWLELEHEARTRVDARDWRRLEELGIVMPEAAAGAVDRAVAERTRDLAVLHRLQAIVERRRAGARQATGSGAIATSSPPSSS
ncbi:MAG: hypothetical protein ACR2JV_09230 [Gaiellales bacterium]